MSQANRIGKADQAGKGSVQALDLDADLNRQALLKAFLRMVCMQLELRVLAQQAVDSAAYESTYERFLRRAARGRGKESVALALLIKAAT